MKKLSKLTSVTLLSVTLLTTTTPVLASTVQASTTENVNNSEATLSLSTQKKLDPYVKVEHNQYILSEDAKSAVSEEEYNIAKQMIEQTNTAVANTGSIINKKTKVATNQFTLSDDTNSIVSLDKGTLATKHKKYHYGVNKVIGHWNYIRVYLNKTTARAVAAGTVSGLGALIAEYVTDGLASAAVAAITASVATLVDSGIKGGVWIDYNFLTRKVTNTGWQ